VLETTGIAEPPALLARLARVAPAERVFALAGVVCAVDVTAAIDTLARREEAVSQVTSADRLLLTKLDLAPPGAVDAVHRRLAGLRPAAERAAFPRTADGDRALVAWLLAPRRAAARASAPARAHRHQLVAASFVADEPLVAAALLAVIDGLADRLLRVKGFVHLAGEPRRAFLERASGVTTLTHDAPWAGPPRTELVMIGEGLDEPAIRRQLWACRTAAAPAPGGDLPPAAG
jgi:G3E family GTPase